MATKIGFLEMPLRFEVIPVIDLMGGQVVRAQRGERDRYQPISSSLCTSSDPLQVARALLEVYPFRSLYIADLDAIRQRGNHLQTVAMLRSAFPQLEIWLDAGLGDIASCLPWQALDIACVIGSESQPDMDSVLRLIGHLGHDRAILSLDSLNGQFRGPAALLENPALWPERIIAMNLARIGSHDGPDIDLLHHLQQQSGGRKVYAAGGMRHGADLQTLADLSVAGALIASALHDGHITASDLTRLR